MRALIVVLLAAVWGYAVFVWPELPDEIPMHFGLSGEPDRFAAKSVWSWFLFPAMATVFGVGLGWLLPPLLRHLAATNSPLLNLPDKARFEALPVEARLRVIAHVDGGLRAIAAAVVLLLGWSVFASGQVALGRWRGLPIGPTLGGVALMIVCAVWIAVVTGRAVRREAEAQ